jgi:hypothetical protein
MSKRTIADMEDGYPPQDVGPMTAAERAELAVRAALESPTAGRTKGAPNMRKKKAAPPTFRAVGMDSRMSDPTYRDLEAVLAAAKKVIARWRADAYDFGPGDAAFDNLATICDRLHGSRVPPEDV